MLVKIKRLVPNAVIPQYAHTTDAGLDLVATSMSFDDDGNVVYGTGLAFEIPEGFVGLLFPRSSNCKKDLALTNSVGVIDSGYRGEVTMKFKPAVRFSENMFACHRGPNSPVYGIGDRIGQMIILPYPEIKFWEVDELSESDRGTNGYGSTDR